MNTNRSRLSRWVGGLATRRYLPWADRYLHWLRHPLGVMVCFGLAAAACGCVLHPNSFLLMYADAIVIVLGLAWPWLSLLGVEGELAFERPRGREFQPSRIRVTLRNRFPWPAWGLTLGDGFAIARTDAEQTDGARGERVGEPAGVATISGWSCSQFEWDFVPERRGEYPMQTPAVATAFPFGLWTARRALQTGGRLLVWPHVFSLGSCQRSPSRECFADRGALNKPGQRGEFFGVRQYQLGDALRRIHWGKTAAYDRLMVREQQALAKRRIQIVLDNSRESHAGDDFNRSLEWAVRAAASLIDALRNEETQLDVLIDRRRFAAADSKQSMFDALARLKPANDSSLPELLELPSVRRFHGDLQLVITSPRMLASVSSEAETARRRVFVSEPKDLAKISLQGAMPGAEEAREAFRTSEAADAEAATSGPGTEECHVA